MFEDWYQDENNNIRFFENESKESLDAEGKTYTRLCSECDVKMGGRNFFASAQGEMLPMLAGVTVPSSGVNSSDNNGFNSINNIIGGTSLINSVIGFDAKLNSTHIYRYAQRINGSVVSAAELTAAHQSNASRVLNVSKTAGKILGGTGGLVIAADVLYNSEIRASHGVNAFMTGIAFTGLGAPVSGLWFVADFGTGLFTNRSLSDRLDERVGAPLVDWDW
jgi:hypothetical protein